MSLHALLASEHLRRATHAGDYGALPTPYQMSLLVGVLLASMDQLREYCVYLTSRRRRAELSPIVRRSALAFTLAVLLAGGVILADTVLHYVTTTVEFSQITSLQAGHGFGRGLSPTCLKFDRLTYGWPCSVGLGWNNPNLFEEQNEYVRLAHNTSDVSSIQVAAVSSGLISSLTYLVPASAASNQSIEYSTSSIGVATSCKLISPAACNMTASGPSDIYSNFTCGPLFFSTLGLTPSPSEADGMRTPDAARSFLMYKPASNLMYSYFTSAYWSKIYNTVGYNDSGQVDPDLLPYSDEQLLNPMFLALAARLPMTAFPPSSSMLNSSLTSSNSGNAYIDFILSCSVASYDVTYTAVQSGIRNIRSARHQNGSVLEIFHGAQLYTGVGNSGYDLQDYLVQAALASSVASNETLSTAQRTAEDSFADKFAELYSMKVLSKIGAYTTPRENILQQTRRTLLVAKVPIAALASLIALSLIYPILGIALAIRGWKVSGKNVQEIATQLSLAGLSAAAFGEPPRRQHHLKRSTSDLAARKRDNAKEETRRVVVEGNEKEGFQFRVMGYGKV